MAGIYIHIPYCKQACHYCDFHFSTSLQNMDNMHAAICQEIAIRKPYLEGENIETIYFGGGTPSLFSSAQLEKVLATVNNNFKVSENAEITLEANPDDLTLEKLKELKQIGINRLSIGIQSFDEERLKFLNRSHNAAEALDCVKNAQSAGFENLTVDLIYAIPPESMSYWERDLNMAIELDVPHISLYGLTIEERTVFGNWKTKGRLQETSEDIAADQYRLAIETLITKGYAHYEVSNFAKPGFRSRHNSAYWSGASYLGIGPGAHSFNGTYRAHNIRNNAAYIARLGKGEIPENIETLTHTQRMNEYILIRLRTCEGLDTEIFKLRFEQDVYADKAVKIEQYKNQGLLHSSNNTIALSTDGFMVADEIALGLFYEE
ncbi:MAG: radical SAM family heme chaperone HemW [Cyclobacteriaceae bacterium]